MPQNNTGKVVQIIGAVVDIKFDKDSLPKLLNAIEIQHNGGTLVVEVAQHIGDDVVRCIAMGSTDGLVRGVDAVDTGSPITVPVGKTPLAESSICWANPLTTSPLPRRTKDGLSTVKPPPTRNSRLQTRYLKQASR